MLCMGESVTVPNRRVKIYHSVAEIGVAREDRPTGRRTMLEAPSGLIPKPRGKQTVNV